ELMGTLGKTTISVPRARLETTEGGTAEWKSKTLSAYRRRTKEVDALIAGSYLAGTNTRRVGRALASLFRGAVSKDTVSRVWRKIKRRLGGVEQARSEHGRCHPLDPRWNDGTCTY